MDERKNKLPIVPPFIESSDYDLLHPLQTGEISKIPEEENTYPYLLVRINNLNPIPIVLTDENERGQLYDRPCELEIPALSDFVGKTILFRTPGKQVKKVEIIGLTSSTGFFTSGRPKEIIIKSEALNEQEYYIENIRRKYPPHS